MDRSRPRVLARVAVAFGLAALVAASSASAATLQSTGAPEITDARVECFINVPYPLVDAEIRPAEEVQAAKVYFRAFQGPHFYAVDMEPSPEGFTAVLPVPGPETEQVVYYVEAVAASFEASRSEEYITRVVDEEDCDERRFLGDDPGIVVYATEEGAARIPAGFLSIGIAAAVPSTGATAAVAGGGLGPGAIMNTSTVAT